MEVYLNHTISASLFVCVCLFLSYLIKLYHEVYLRILICNRGRASSNPEMNTYHPSENTALSIFLDDDEQYMLRLYNNQHLLRVKRVLYQISYYSDDVQSSVEFHELNVETVPQI